MPEVNRVKGKHLFPSVGSNTWNTYRCLCCMYVGSWHIEIGYRTPLVRTLYATYA